MIRKSKFRIWDSKKKKFLKITNKYKISLNGDGKVFYKDNEFSYTHQKNLICSEYIGCNDKYGKEIYDGDIVEYGGRRLYVAYNERIAAYTFSGLYIGNSSIPSNQVEVVGNIWQ